MPSMTLLIGIDEAGYGPNLGPLCIGATAWEVEVTDGGQPKVDLYELLADIVSPKPVDGLIAIADSKQLYKPASHSKSSGLHHLERGVLSALTLLGQLPTKWQTLVKPPSLPWYDGFDCTLPIDTDLETINSLAECLDKSCSAAGVRLVDVRARLVFPHEFNQLTEHYGTKGAALSHVSIELLKTVLQNATSTSDLTAPRSTQITCDKHGGRNRYAALLQHHFPDVIVQVVEESRPMSRYRWGSPKSQTEICFRSKGEAELPVALASMIAKYQRELAMQAFNSFWATHVPGIKPTAGYPLDAKRFKAEIDQVQSKLGIDDQILWRNR